MAGSLTNQAIWRLDGPDKAIAYASIIKFWGILSKRRGFGNMYLP